MNVINLPTTRWLLSNGDEETQELLTRELAVNPLISKILTSRNIQTTEEAKKYLSPSCITLL